MWRTENDGPGSGMSSTGVPGEKLSAAPAPGVCRVTDAGGWAICRSRARSRCSSISCWPGS
ncbi:conserved hypothetical protein [Ricinus communis]|uniref:Uncharacterized protein n=1 Tax=Ricinus communis TaxID=3988 RepID=B9THT8_RICCO|nr:conserved hypothetical protein [Ricinus communis]